MPTASFPGLAHFDIIAGRSLDDAESVMYMGSGLLLGVTPGMLKGGMHVFHNALDGLPPVLRYGDDLARVSDLTRYSDDLAGLRPLSVGPGGGPRVARTAPLEADWVNLASPKQTKHILDGEIRPNGTFGGGHRFGTGFGKSEFPQGWSDAEIMHHVSDVATDPSLVWRPGDLRGDFFVNGIREGVDIEVLIRKGEIWTAYPKHR